MSLISFTPLSDGVTGVNAAATNTPLSTIYNDYNGNITNANIAASAAIAGSKLEFGGAWTSWTPTWTNLTIGNGTYANGYVQVGKIVIARMKLTLGSTTSVGSTPYFTLPVTAKSSVYTQYESLGTGTVIDSSAVAPYQGYAAFRDTTTAYPFTFAVSGGNVTQVGISATGPFTWATSDTIIMNMVYEAA